MEKYTKSYVKNRTQELYDSLPQEKSERIKCLDVRDEILEINKSFFTYLVSTIFVNNSYVSFEDKLQTAYCQFLSCWWWYKWKGDETHKGYRDDLSFAVFYLPRLKEMIKRELDEVGYSVRRSLCMKVGEQLGKHWAQVTYEDLSDPRLKLSTQDMNALKAIFGTLYPIDMDEVENYIYGDYEINGGSEFEISLEYNTIEELLIHEMQECEEKLSDKKLKKMADMYQIDLEVLYIARPRAEEMLYRQLKESIKNRYSD